MRRGKVYFFVCMSGLTATAFTACRWQYRRYYQSTDRWQRINQTLHDFTPSPLTSDAMPGYSLVSATGVFGDDEANVMRVKDGRMGYYVVKPFYLTDDVSDDGAGNDRGDNSGAGNGVETGGSTEGNNGVGHRKKGVLVNVGWVPEDISLKKSGIATNKKMSNIMI